MKRGLFTLLAGALLLTASTTSCDHVDDERIPPFAVNIVFRNQAEWDFYGNPGSTEYRRFISALNIPSNFPWTAMTHTGYGGVLLVGDIHGNPLAYDLACPVECQQDVRVIVEGDNRAHCPRCHSVYEIYTNYGLPISGPAAEYGYGLQRYYVGAGYNGEWRVITR